MKGKGGTSVEAMIEENTKETLRRKQQSNTILLN